MGQGTGRSELRSWRDFWRREVSDKIGVITNLLEKCDSLIIGGGMAYTFFKAMGYEIGTSLLDADSIELAKNLMAKAKARGVNLLLPVDNVVATAYAADAEHKIVDSDKMPEGWMGLDIGPKTIELFKKVIIEAKTVIWNGPMGVFEMPAFAEARAGSRGLRRVQGTTNTAAATRFRSQEARFAKQMTHISTGGGASLEFLEGKVLPGVAVLNDK